MHDINDVLDELNDMIDSLDETATHEDMGRVLIELRDAVRDDLAAPRQGALDEQQDVQARQAGDRVEQLGAAVSVRQLTPASAGHAVRFVVDGPLWLEPADAHAIADALNAAALEAIHADRAGRHRA